MRVRVTSVIDTVTTSHAMADASSVTWRHSSAQGRWSRADPLCARAGQRCPKWQDEDVRRTRAEAAPDARVLRGAAARGRVKPGWEAGRCQRRVLHYRAVSYTHLRAHEP